MLQRWTGGAVTAILSFSAKKRMADQRPRVTNGTNARVVARSSSRATQFRWSRRGIATGGTANPPKLRRSLSCFVPSDNDAIPQGFVGVPLTWFSRYVVQIAIQDGYLPLNIEFPGSATAATWSIAWMDWQKASRHDAGIRWNTRRNLLHTEEGTMPTQRDVEGLIDALLRLDPSEIRRDVTSSNLHVFFSCAYRSMVYALRDLRQYQAQWRP